MCLTADNTFRRDLLPFLKASCFFPDMLHPIITAQSLCSLHYNNQMLRPVGSYINHVWSLMLHLEMLSSYQQDVSCKVYTQAEACCLL